METINLKNKPLYDCPKCGSKVTVYNSDEGTCSYELVDKMLDSSIYKIPFYCDMCGAIKFPIRGVFDRVYIWPIRTPKIPIPGGLIELPDSSIEDTDYGVVLACGPGYYGKAKKDKKDKWWPTFDLKVGQRVIYDKTVPYTLPVKGTDGGDYVIKIMSFLDVKAIANGTELERIEFV